MLVKIKIWPEKISCIPTKPTLWLMHQEPAVLLGNPLFRGSDLFQKVFSGILVGYPGFFEGEHIPGNSSCALNNAHSKRTTGSFPQSHT